MTPMLKKKDSVPEEPERDETTEQLTQVVTNLETALLRLKLLIEERTNKTLEAGNEESKTP